MRGVTWFGCHKAHPATWGGGGGGLKVTEHNARYISTNEQSSSKSELRTEMLKTDVTDDRSVLAC